MKAKLQFGPLSLEWETPENDIGVVLRQLLTAYAHRPHGTDKPDTEPAAAPQPQPKPVVQEPQQADGTQPVPEPLPAEAPNHYDIIPPEPKEREPLGKAIERLQKEKKTRGGRLNTQAVVLKKGGDVKWFETTMEAALFLGVSLSSVSKAASQRTLCKGWWVERDDPKVKP